MHRGTKQAAPSRTNPGDPGEPVVRGVAIPPHTHSGITSNSCSDVRWVDANSGGSDHYVCGASHTHAVAVGPASVGAITGATSSADSRPEFVTIALCRKN